ncbi:MAG: nuclear transport factor 2 family protein [Chitinophagia bacterium]|nr:nuclear transport factor 2 family protein [Chitinophagia bacterium]
MKVFYILIFVNVVLAACRPAGDVLTLQEVTTVMNQFDKGWKEKAPALVDSVLSPHYLYFTQSGRTFTRAALLATAGSQIYSLQNMSREQISVDIDGNAAVVNTIWSGKGVYHGENFDDRQRCSVTIVKHQGKVKILSEHCTPIR